MQRSRAFDFVLRPLVVEELSLTVACAAARRASRPDFASVLAHIAKNHDQFR